MELKGKHAVVTGGGRGIGASVAKTLFERGASVTLMGRTLEVLGETVKRFDTADMPQTIEFVQLDVSKHDAVQLAFDKAVNQLGAVDILVNNAGIAESVPFEKTSIKQFDKTMDVNLRGTFSCTQAALQFMNKDDYGRIINIASTAALKGYAYVSAYSASKHAVVGLTRSLALELAKTKITVNAICPGFTETEMLDRSIENIMNKTDKTAEEAKRILSANNPQHKLIQPKEIADTAVWLCQVSSSSITGQSIVIAGGEVM